MPLYFKLPANQFMHGAALANTQFKNVVSPNVDTVYSQVWYDLSEEPIVYVLPEKTMPDRSVTRPRRARSVGGRMPGTMGIVTPRRRQRSTKERKYERKSV